MDLKKTGAFIFNARKKKDWTQKELAEAIGVTDKAISRWETGRGFPDAAILQSLAAALDVSINEIVTGESIPPEAAKEKADSALLEALAYSKQMSRTVIGTILIILGASLLIFPQLATGMNGMAFFYASGVASIFAGAALLVLRKASSRCKKRCISTRLAGGISIAALLAAIILEALPYGAALIFADGPNQQIRQTYAYFSLMPFGYASFFPLITAGLTVVTALLTVIAFVSGYQAMRMQNAVFTCSVIALITSILAWAMYGTQRITVVGIAISVLLAAAVVFQAFAYRQARRST